MHHKDRNVPHLYFTLEMFLQTEAAASSSFIPLSFSADVLSCEGDYYASDKVFLSRLKVNVIQIQQQTEERLELCMSSEAS